MSVLLTVLGSGSVNIRKLTKILVHLHKYIVTSNMFHVNMPYYLMAKVVIFLDDVFYISAVTDCRNTQLVELLIRRVRVEFFVKCILGVTHLPVKFYLLMHSISLYMVCLFICCSIFHELSIYFSQLPLKNKMVDLFELSSEPSVMLHKI